MHSREIDELVRAATLNAGARGETVLQPVLLVPGNGHSNALPAERASNSSSVGELIQIAAQVPNANSSSSQKEGAGASPSSARDVAALTTEIAQLRRTVSLADSVRQNTQSSRPDTDDGGSAVKTALQIAGRVTGVGPLITGLMGLFGSSGEKQEEPLTSFVLPSAVNVNAGLTRSGEMASINYAQNGLARENQAMPASPQVQINVNAMDSRSFLDHKEDIARAVREAMLHSHSLNDVVSEL